MAISALAQVPRLVEIKAPEVISGCKYKGSEVKTMMMKREDGSLSRTQAMNGLLASMGIIVGMFPQLQSQIPPDVYPWLFVGLSVINAYLRATTTQGIQ